MDIKQLKRLKTAADRWDIRIQSREPGHEWYKVAFGLKKPEDGEAIVKLLNDTLNKILSDNTEIAHSASAGSVTYAPIGLASAARIYVLASDEYISVGGNAETSRILDCASRQLELAADLYSQNK